MKLCHRCQASNQLEAAFCANCGFSLKNQVIRPLNKSPKPKEFNWIPVVAIGTVVLVGFAVFITFFLRMIAPNRNAKPVIITSSAQYTPTPAPIGTPAPTPAQTRGSVIDQIEVDIEWEKGGFGSVRLADVVLTNKSTKSVKDIVIECGLFAPSKTRLGRVRQTIYERLYPAQKRDFKQVNFGFINNQTSSVGCVVTDATVLDD
jgi:ribosomal protein L40E